MKDIAKRIYQYAQIKSEENVILLFDETTRELADAFDATTKINLDQFERPLTHIPSELTVLFPCDVLLYFIEKKSNEQTDELKFRNDLNAKVESFGRVGNLLSVTTQMLESAFAIDPDELKNHTLDVLQRAKQLTHIRVTSPSGCDFTVEFGSYNWIASTGFIQRGKTRNIMPCEVFTFPQNVTGKIVIDGTYSYFAVKNIPINALQKKPLTWIVKDSRIVEVHCNDKELEKMATAKIYGEKYADHIGEFGIGTNSGMKQLFGNIMHDEKFPGIHIAHGHGYPKVTGALYECNTHFDGVILNPIVKKEDGSTFDI